MTWFNVTRRHQNGTDGPCKSTLSSEEVECEKRKEKHYRKKNTKGSG